MQLSGGLMKKIIIISITLIILIVIFMMVFGSEESPSQLANGKPAGKTTPVKTAILQAEPFAEYLEVTGSVKARNRVDIVVEVNGTLKQILKPKGSFVRKGDTLAVLDNEEIRAAYDDAGAGLNQAKVNYRSSKILYEKKAISENDYLTAKYSLDRAQAQYDLSKARYDKLSVTAPISGYVNDRFQDLGAYMQPTTPLFDLIDNSYAKIIAGVAERFRNDIHVGTLVHLSFDALPDVKIDGKVSFVLQSIDPSNRTFQIEIEIPNPNRKLMPNMIANLKLLKRSYTDKISVPVDAVIESEKGRYVFVETNNRARKTPIEFIAVSGDSVLVNGLQPNQHLIVLGHHELTDGDSLQVVRD
jgi:membrane fusion protein (multidrug efflux system)